MQGTVWIINKVEHISIHNYAILSLASHAGHTWILQWRKQQNK